MPKPHQFALIGMGSGLKAIGQRFFHNQGMIAHAVKGIAHPVKTAVTVVPDRAGLAVHQPGSADDLTPEGLAD
jgi:hypothetical protein